MSLYLQLCLLIALWLTIAYNVYCILGCWVLDWITSRGRVGEDYTSPYDPGAREILLSWPARLYRFLAREARFRRLTP